MPSDLGPPDGHEIKQKIEETAREKASVGMRGGVGVSEEEFSGLSHHNIEFPVIVKESWPQLTIKLHKIYRS